jgi:hypothetical protein
MGATRGAHATRCRRRRRRCHGGTPLAEIAKASTAGDTSTSTVLCFVLGPDPLAEALGARSDPLDLPVSVDPMMDELAAVLVTRSAAAPASGCRPPEGQTSLWDPTSTAPQCMTESPPSSPVRGALASTAAPSEEFPPSPGDAPMGQVSLGGPMTAPQCTMDPPALPMLGAPSAPLVGTTTLSKDESPSLLPGRQPDGWPGSLRWSRWQGHHPSLVLPPSKRRRLGGPCPRGAGGLPLSGWTTSPCPSAARCSS